MSTKTTFKRIALVAVASLGFGMLSVAPSQAAGMLADTLLNAAERAIVSAIPPPAFAGDRGITPMLKAATATSAMRLKVVFVDICFLSISRLSDDPSAGFG